MAKNLAMKRLTKDYNKLKNDPIEHCWVLPFEDNFLSWHFMFELQDYPFEKCQVLCVIMFPSQYPMKAPDIKVLTPTGRFEVNRTICMTNTGYHSDSWSPLWSISNIIIGFISSFNETQHGIGHLTDNDISRKLYSGQSSEYNMECYPKIVTDLFSRGISKSVKEDGTSNTSETTTECDVKRRKLASGDSTR
ncbi:hypothetical protein COB52_04105 [Candidatus Kaiserbacteria bacterium]|nr:MAG: hypothetical protein COB52_04105 [Candidatus Kaiserbacteria bacterium]